MRRWTIEEVVKKGVEKPENLSPIIVMKGEE
jgi:hypothetical protein